MCVCVCVGGGGGGGGGIKYHHNKLSVNILLRFRFPERVGVGGPQGQLRALNTLIQRVSSRWGSHKECFLG